MDIIYCLERAGHCASCVLYIYMLCHLMSPVAFFFFYIEEFGGKVVMKLVQQEPWPLGTG